MKVQNITIQESKEKVETYATIKQWLPQQTLLIASTRL